MWSVPSPNDTRDLTRVFRTNGGYEFDSAFIGDPGQLYGIPFARHRVLCLNATVPIFNPLSELAAAIISFVSTVVVPVIVPKDQSVGSFLPSSGRGRIGKILTGVGHSHRVLGVTGDRS